MFSFFTGLPQITICSLSYIYYLPSGNYDEGVSAGGEAVVL